MFKLTKSIERFLLLFVFAASTLFFWLQHSPLNWDFAAYVLNAQYWFGNGSYFELMRPPLVQLLIGVFSFLGWQIAEYTFILFVQLLFFYAVKQLSKQLNWNLPITYALALSPFALGNGLNIGSELLTAALLLLTIVNVLKDDYKSGFWFGLSILTRYPMFPFAVLLLFHKSWKKMATALALTIAVIAPWLVYNYAYFGNFFASIADAYAINYLYRQSVFFDISGELIALSAVLALSFAGLFHKWEKSSWLMAVTALIVIIQFFTIPYKYGRYLFLIIIPLLYFSYKGLELIISKLHLSKSTVTLVILTLFAIGLAFTVYGHYTHFPSDLGARTTIVDLQARNLTNCSILSDNWVLLNYYGQRAMPAPREQFIEQNVQRGHVVIINQTIYAPIHCNAPEPGVLNYRELLAEEVYTEYGYRINTDACFVLFSNNAIGEMTCNAINGRGFTMDANRAKS